ncbi:MAG: NADH-quinone oxidoreductase subunit B family protein [Dehalococcoidales bacterium]|jgi:Ni,Fe-hydrogenase III small subunit|nr:NADH-quinone oxidoreductase subunit B family protein [Dehalococcoidales bacterium]
MVLNLLRNFTGHKKAKDLDLEQDEFHQVGIELKKNIDAVFGRSLAIRELDSGSDNAAEIELNNLGTPYYDIERFGISFVASPRHADIIVITGAVTHNMALAVKKTFEAMPQPGFVIAVGDDACNGGILKDTYAVMGGADKILPVDIKIPGNPPTPLEIMQGLLALMEMIRQKKVKPG